MTSDAPTKRSILHSGTGPFLWALLFLALFMAVFYAQKPSPFVIENDAIKNIFATYGPAVGPALALLAMLCMYLLAGIKKIIGLGKFRSLNAIVIILVMSPLLAFGYQLMYREKSYTDIARGIIGLFALPLFLSSLAIIALAILWFALTLLRHSSSLPATR